MLAQLVRVGCSAGGGHHHCDDDLAPFGIFRADDHAVAHRGMFDEHVLDFGGGDVFAASDDRVVGATADEQVAALVKHRHVFGGEPSVSVEDRTDVGVASRHLLSAHEQLTGLAGPENTAVVTADLHLDAG